MNTTVQIQFPNLLNRGKEWDVREEIYKNRLLKRLAVADSIKMFSVLLSQGKIGCTIIGTE